MSAAAPQSRDVPSKLVHGLQASLLLLPDPALHLVLQQLDPCSLACTAVTCSKLSHAVPASIKKVALYCSTSDTSTILAAWFERHGAHMTHCSVAGPGFHCGTEGPNPPHLHSLPYGLRQLQVQGMRVQLGPVDGHPGVLANCSSLTGLDLEIPTTQVLPSAKLAALPEIRSLRLARWHTSGGNLQPHDLPLMQYPLQLTYLSLEYHFDKDEAAQLTQLSDMVNLQHLSLPNLPKGGVPGGIPSQLVKLTYLNAGYYQCCETEQQQLRHLSRFTALQQLSVDSSKMAAGHLSGIQRLTQLTGLRLKHFKPQLTSSSVRSWGCMPSLQSLSLMFCRVQPELFSSCTQLRSLSLTWANLGGAALSVLFTALAGLSLLAELAFMPHIGYSNATPPAGAFTALAASTNLRSLRLDLVSNGGPQFFDLFRPGTVYPHLHNIRVYACQPGRAMALSEQQMGQLCMCCPSLASLSLILIPSQPYSATAWLPLLQLSALTSLKIHEVGATLGSVVEAAAQLTGLKQLALWDLETETDPGLLLLTALTGFEKLTLRDDIRLNELPDLTIKNKACWHNPPDVWTQLLRHLLGDAACRHELLKRSPAAAAAPAELMLAQLAATLAEELSARPSG